MEALRKSLPVLGAGAMAVLCSYTRRVDDPARLAEALGKRWSKAGLFQEVAQHRTQRL